MGMIKGVPVTLYVRSIAGTDSFNRQVYTETAITVDNVLVSPASSDDIVSANDLYGKKAVYTLGIPKGDEHEWEDARIDFFGHSWHSFGFTTEGIECNVPLDWHKKVMVERYA